ncbi:DNA gyrase inhibitor YacG [Paragemmobacter straminiformis]|uniref:DNA gyrase inhibitor YacG n=1 Tax=Paragemmobacter straminiformis TaxID=2045119 RepID=A0A842I3S5_9RHOB|nr:DNA gyrase inhibitor YacG [Gemmobacter straminiformis]
MTCPICRKDSDPKYKPFCSRRCADVDLGRWLKGSYAIPVTEEEAQDDRPDDGGEEHPTRLN